MDRECTAPHLHINLPLATIVSCYNGRRVHATCRLPAGIHRRRSADSTPSHSTPRRYYCWLAREASNSVALAITFACVLQLALAGLLNLMLGLEDPFASKNFNRSGECQCLRVVTMWATHRVPWMLFLFRPALPIPPAVTLAAPCCCTPCC